MPTVIGSVLREEHDHGNALYSVMQANWLAQSAIDFDEQANTVIGAPKNRTIELAERCATFPRLELGEPGAKAHNIDTGWRLTGVV